MRHRWRDKQELEGSVWGPSMSMIIQFQWPLLQGPITKVSPLVDYSSYHKDYQPKDDHDHRLGQPRFQSTHQSANPTD